MKESELRMKTILRYALDAVITIDRDGGIMSWNPESEIVFGWKEEEVYGLHIIILIVGEKPAKRSRFFFLRVLLKQNKL